MNKKLKNKEDFMKKLDCHGRQADLAMTIGRKARCIAFTMADRRSSRFHIFDIQRIAFTMAEILLSLTIIGVVAAITLPALTGNINERTWNTQRKALYARMSQAIALMPSLNGYGIGATETETASNAAEAFITQGLAKVLKINNICDNQHLQDCGLYSKIKTKKGSQYNLFKKLTELNNLFNVSLPELSYSQIDTLTAAFETQNGESFLTFYNPFCQSKNGSDDFLIQPEMCANFIYDLNGKKSPNTVGKDIGVMSVLYSTDSAVVAPTLVGLGSSRGNTYYIAVNYCRDIGDGAHLPNLSELASMFYNKKILDLGGNFYWSSEKYSSTQQKFIYFTSGRQYNWSLNGSLQYQCVKF